MVISSMQRPLPDNTHNSQQRDIHATGGVLTHILGKQETEALRLRLRGHWDGTYLPDNHNFITRAKTMYYFDKRQLVDFLIPCVFVLCL
jgi:hypothetical protein